MLHALPAIASLCSCTMPLLAIGIWQLYFVPPPMGPLISVHASPAALLFLLQQFQLISFCCPLGCRPGVMLHILQELGIQADKFHV